MNDFITFSFFVYSFFFSLSLEVWCKETQINKAPHNLLILRIVYRRGLYVFTVRGCCYLFLLDLVGIEKNIYNLFACCGKQNAKQNFQLNEILLFFFFYFWKEILFFILFIFWYPVWLLLPEILITALIGTLASKGIFFSLPFLLSFSFDYG